MNEVGGEEQFNDGGGSVAAVVAAAAAPPPTRYFWNRRIRHSGQASTLGVYVCVYVCRFHGCEGERGGGKETIESGKTRVVARP